MDVLLAREVKGEKRYTLWGSEGKHFVGGAGMGGGHPGKKLKFS